MLRGGVSSNTMATNRDDPHVIESAHDILSRLALTDDAPCEDPAAVVTEFHDWTARNGYEIDLHRLSELHVHSLAPLDEFTATLVVQWAEDLYPHIFD